MDKSAKAVAMEDVVGSIVLVATVFTGQQVRVVTEFLWKTRPGPCSTEPLASHVETRLCLPYSSDALDRLFHLSMSCASIL